MLENFASQRRIETVPRGELFESGGLPLLLESLFGVEDD